MQQFRHIGIISLCLAALFINGCGAFADAANEDGGLPDAGSGLEFEPNEYIFQGQQKEFTITFIEAPPWTVEAGDYFYISFIKFGDLPPDQIQPIMIYDGVQTIEATIQASRKARTGEHKLELTATLERTGQKQQHHSAWGLFYVNYTPKPDGGSPH